VYINILSQMPKPFNLQDKYFKKAKKLGYRARSVFKLDEIQKKFNVLELGMNVLDIGASPGSWLQYTRAIIGAQAKLIGVDREKIEPLDKDTIIIQVDILDEEIEKLIKDNQIDKFDVILSDAAPNTSGVRDIDHFASMALCQRVIKLTDIFLATRGSVVLKVFQGSDFAKFIVFLKKKFKQVNIFKPQATRGRSFELYIIAKK